MSVYVVRTEGVDGRQHELRRVFNSQATARVAAGWVARALGRFGCPDKWAGGRVSVVDARTGRLLSAARIAPRGVGWNYSHRTPLKGFPPPG